jgi:hypothetical protein
MPSLGRVHHAARRGWPLAARAQQRPLPAAVLLNGDACGFDENERGRTLVAKHR